MGSELHDLGKLDEAERILHQALDLDSRFHLAWAQLGLVMGAREEFEKAAYCFEQAASISLDKSVYTMLANMQLAFDPWSAATNARQALSFDPGWEEASRVLATAQKEIARRQVEEPHED